MFLASLTAMLLFSDISAISNRCQIFFTDLQIKLSSDVNTLSTPSLPITSSSRGVIAKFFVID